MASVQAITLDLGAKAANTSDDPVSEQDPATIGEAVQSAAKAVLDDSTGSTLEVEPRNPKIMDQAVSPLVSRTVGTAGAAALATPADVCSTYSAVDIKNRLEAFAKVYAWSGALATIDFNTGSDHTLGVAVGQDKKWSASGTSGISTSAGATVLILRREPIEELNERPCRSRLERRFT